MQIIHLSIKGPDLERLPLLVQANFPNCHYTLAGQESVHVLVTETRRFTGSNVLVATTIIIDLSQPLKATIQIVTGGGNIGLLRVLGVEKQRNEQILTYLQGICQTHHWELTKKPDQAG